MKLRYGSCHPDKLADLDLHVQCTLFLKEGTEFGEKKKLYTQSAGPQRKKSCLRGLANNKGADQPAHLCSLTSTFVIPLLESIISRLATSEILIF